MVDIDEKLRKLKSVDDQADLLWLLYISGDTKDRIETDEIIDILLHEKIGHDFSKQIRLDPERPEYCEGEYYLGDVIYPEKVFARFGLRENEWLKHILITGMSGVGKTNLSFQILRELKRHSKPFMVFDWKRNYRDLLQLPEFKGIKVYTAGNKLSPLFFNPLIPPDSIEPGIWLARLVDIIKHAYFLGEGVEYLLRLAIENVYERRGVFDGTGSYPTFAEIKTYVSSMQLTGRMSLWKASTMRALESMTYKYGLGISFETDEMVDIGKILEQDVIIEMDSVSDNDKVFFTEALILWIYEYRKNESKREVFKHAILIEEAHHLLSNQKENHDGGETIIETSLRQIREFGEAVIAIDQEPGKLSDSIKANTYCKTTFNLGNGKDILDISACMMLEIEEMKCIDLLEVGHAIVKLKGRAYRPMLIRVPLIPVKKGKITDDVLKKILQGIPLRV
jgi:DNA helicase HerA-like ATPase